MMKRLFLMACVAGVSLACVDEDKKAAGRLQAAQEAFERGDYAEAKLQIDSIKLLHPKAYDTRHAGNRLMYQVELKEQETVLATLDSLLADRLGRLEELASAYVLEKDTAYQQVGHYLTPAQVVEKNLHRSYLRFQVDERGKMSMTSVYCGAKPVHHTSVKVAAPDGSFVEAPVSADSYETTVMGECIEKADYPLGVDSDFIRFICLNKDKTLRVTYVGDRTYTTSMLPADRQAAAAVSELATVLAAIADIRKEQEEAAVKIAFVKARIEQKKVDD